jgi:tripartite-type tricarboxylate transporter receptor subunit TctC
MERRAFIASAGSLLALGAGPVLAQSGYPNHSIKLTVPFAPGGTTDIVARVIADPLSRILGQTVIVDNKGGGGGIVGALDTAHQAPDGYNLGIATVSTTATNPAINPKAGYNPLTDFTPIVNVAATPNIIAVNPKFPAKDYKAFVEELRKNPGKYSYASSGTGGIANMLMELYKSIAGVHVTHIPYRGSGPALNDVVAGNVGIMFDNLPSTLPFIQQGRLVPIVVAAPHRLKELPNVPTFKEVGLEPVNRLAYYGIVGPKGLPRDIVMRIHDATVKALQDPAVRKRIEETGSIVVGNTPEQFAEQIRNEFAVYKKVVETAHLKLE